MCSSIHRASSRSAAGPIMAISSPESIGVTSTSRHAWAVRGISAGASWCRVGTRLARSGKLSHLSVGVWYVLRIRRITTPREARFRPQATPPAGGSESARICLSPIPLSPGGFCARAIEGLRECDGSWTSVFLLCFRHDGGYITRNDCSPPGSVRNPWTVSRFGRR